jgi:hypothetical protein
MKSREAVWGTWTCGALLLEKTLGTCQYFFLNNFINLSLRILSIGLAEASGAALRRAC